MYGTTYERCREEKGLSATCQIAGEVPASYTEVVLDVSPFLFLTDAQKAEIKQVKSCLL